mmetsp:Transcript_19634/g.53954  ORF Transcript_19634/g.53954 Transcript_19634/m.53954 type:complete len:244 (-) Transcript_19634:411-1142(-)
MQAIQWELSTRAAKNIIIFCVLSCKVIAFSHRCRMRPMRTMRSSLASLASLRHRKIFARCINGERLVSTTLSMSKGKTLTKSSTNHDFRYLIRSFTGSLNMMIPPLCGRWTSTLRKNCRTISRMNITSTTRFTEKKTQSTPLMNTVSKGVTIPTYARAMVSNKSQYCTRVLRGSIKLCTGFKATLRSADISRAVRSFHCRSGYVPWQRAWRLMFLGSTLQGVLCQALLLLLLNLSMTRDSVLA